MLVVDEADLVFSYGYEHDLKTLLRLNSILSYIIKQQMYQLTITDYTP